MNEKELAELRNPDSWDDTRADVHQPVKAPRSILSVAFSQEDFAQVAQAARARGMRVSEYVRSAALGKVAQDSGSARVLSCSASDPWQGNMGRAAESSSSGIILGFPTSFRPRSA